MHVKVMLSVFASFQQLKDQSRKVVRHLAKPNREEKIHTRKKTADLMCASGKMSDNYSKMYALFAPLITPIEITLIQLHSKMAQSFTFAHRLLCIRAKCLTING